MQIMAQPEIKKLKKLRLELKYTQEDFAAYAGLRIKTYRQAEQRGRTSYPTAATILKGLNGLRGARGISLLALDDLELDIT